MDAETPLGGRKRSCRSRALGKFRKRGEQPVAVGRGDFRDGQADDFRHFIRMMGQNACLQGRKMRGTGLDLGDGFRGGFDGSLPAVKG